MTSETKKMKDEYYAELSELSSQTVEYVRGIPVVKTFAQSVESFNKLYSLIIKIKDGVLKLTMSYTNKKWCPPRIRVKLPLPYAIHLFDQVLQVGE